ncbi:MAG: hypothetical protein ACRDGT_03300 [Candidatus Limnocylindria bacterium]
MSLFKVAAAAFIQYSCQCCGRVVSGAPQYRAGLVQCESCASGTHGHQRRFEAA